MALILIGTALPLLLLLSASRLSPTSLSLFLSFCRSPWYASMLTAGREMMYVRPSSADVSHGAGPCVDSTNGFARSQERAQAKVHRSRPRSSGTRAGPRSAVLAAQAASGETATFLAFVDLLTSKSQAEAQSILALAAQAVHNRFSSPLGNRASAGLTKRPTSPYALGTSAMRRSASADELHRPFGSAKQSRASPLVGAQQRRSPVRSRSAGGLLTSSQSDLLSTMQLHVGNPDRQPVAPVQPFAEHAYEVRTRMFWDYEATRLQAAWRGRQHRRICRYVRARTARIRRLQWLADHGEVSMFLEWVGAATRIQSAFRGKKGRSRPVPERAARQKACRSQLVPLRTQRLTWRDCVAEDGQLCVVQMYDTHDDRASWPEPTTYN